jgi:hypothetical protein
MKTNVGSAGFDDHRFRGFALYGELIGSESFAGLLALAIDGRRRTDDEARMLDDMAAVIAVADPHIWPCKLVRVASAYGGSLAGVAASTYLLQDAWIGPHTVGRSAATLEDIADRIGFDPSTSVLTEELASQIAKRSRLLGFGVPARPQDERVPALAARIRARGRANLPYWRLTERLIEAMRTERALEPNIGIAFAAAALDLGFASEHIGLLTTALWQIVPVANAAEGAAQAPAILQSLPLADVEYVGPAPQPTVRSLAHHQVGRTDSEQDADDHSEQP